MRKVFLDNLPRKGKQIDWKNSKGYKIKFTYDDIEGELFIIDYMSKNRQSYVIIEYNCNENFRIGVGDLSNGKLGGLLGKYNSNYIYSIGEIIENGKNGTLKIIKQTKMRIGNRNLKSYIYKCLNCGDKHEKTEDELKRNGCAICSGNKILKGYNDLWTKRPDIAKLLKYPEIGYKVGLGSGKSEEVFICPECHHEQSQSLNNVTKQGFSCKKCGDGVSYPEKIMINVLIQLGIKFKKEKIFEWSRNIIHENDNLCGKKRYDFYIPKLNCIIETHGEQHYRYCGFLRTLEEEQENDRIKEQLAKENGIENYIVIDCQKSEIEYIKENILKSNLSKMLNLNEVDWDECNFYACDSNVKIASDLWRDGKSLYEISKNLNVHIETIRNYIKRGAEIGWCEYDSDKISKERYIKLANMNKKKIVQLSLDNKLIKIWNSISDACDYFNVSHGNLHKALNNNVRTAYGYRWMYKDKYDKNKNKLDSNKLKIGNKREVVQLSLNGDFIKVWGSISDASKAINKRDSSNIHQNCNNKTKSAYGYKWMYKEDYDKYIEEQSKELIHN